MTVDAVLAARAPSHVHGGNALAFLTALPDESVDAVITDPPYASGASSTAGRMASTSAKYVQGGSIRQFPDFVGDQRDQRSHLHWCVLWLAECLRVTKPGGPLLCFTDWRQYPTFSDAVQAADWKWNGVAVWDKTLACRPRPGGFRSQTEFALWATKPGGPPVKKKLAVYLPGVFSVPVERDKKHIAGKPIALMEALMELVPKGGVVLDPFAGSASTGVAAIRTGRRFLGAEMVPAYLTIARERLAEAERGARPPRARRQAA